MTGVDAVCAAWREAGSAVFLTGAGVSTESGLRDFTGANGRYAEHSTQEILSHDFMLANPSLFQQFCRERLYAPNARPNVFHKAAAAWERSGLSSGIITQNIDRLHHAAGSVNIIELHGNMQSVYCDACGAEFPLLAFMSKPIRGEHRCNCGGMCRPAIVLYGEKLSGNVLGEALSIIDRAPLLIVAGTRVRVTAPLDIMSRFKERPGVSVYIGDTPPDTCDFDITIKGQIGEITEQLVRGIGF
ncbi:NAD-dependent protein deacetylase [Clostridia bacterium]|nr:NAD-dependent protein deacetylase [Clostridia bacterium]